MIWVYKVFLVGNKETPTRIINEGTNPTSIAPSKSPVKIVYVIAETKPNTQDN